MIKLIDFAHEIDPDPPGAILYGRRHHWRVVATEPVESRVWPWRWRYTVEPLGPHHGQIPADAHRISAYRKGEGPVDCFGPPPPIEEAS